MRKSNGCETTLPDPGPPMLIAPSSSGRIIQQEDCITRMRWSPLVVIFDLSGSSDHQLAAFNFQVCYPSLKPWMQ